MRSRVDATIWDRILLVLVVAVGAYGLLLVLAGGFLGDTVFDVLGFGPDDGNIADGDQREYVTFVFGILGAVIVGWMVTIAAIAIGPLRRRERWAWWAIVIPIGSWFVIDTGFSLVRGYLGHVAFNVGFAVALAVPLVPLRRLSR